MMASPLWLALLLAVSALQLSGAATDDHLRRSFSALAVPPKPPPSPKPKPPPSPKPKPPPPRSPPPPKAAATPSPPGSSTSTGNTCTVTQTCTNEWWCQACRSLVPAAGCLQTWCFKCSSYTQQAYECQACMATKGTPIVQEWCLECVYQIRKLPSITYACSSICAAYNSDAVGMSQCTNCLVKAPLNNKYGCESCQQATPDGSPQRKQCLTCVAAGLAPYGCQSCASMATPAAQTGCFNCVTAGVQIPACQMCAQVALPAAQPPCFKCVQAGVPTFACQACAQMGSTAAQNACFSCVAKPGAVLWQCTSSGR